MTISDIQFGRNKSARWIGKKTQFYVYHSDSETAFINSHYAGSWVGIEDDIESVLIHEDLHKIIWRVENAGASKGLDRWCASRSWRYRDKSGVCFSLTDIYGKPKRRFFTTRIDSYV